MHRAKSVATVCGIVLGLLTVLPAAAQIGYQGFELRAGGVLPVNYDSGFSLGAALDLGEVHSGFRLFPAVFYSQAEDDSGAFERDITDLAVGAEVRYTPDSAPAWYFGAGPYVHYTEREVVHGPFAGGPPGRFETDDTDVGAMGVVGYRLELGGLDTFAEVRANAFTSFDTATLMVGFSF